MALHLVTGYKGNAHITSADQGVFNAGCVGSDEYVFTTGRMFEAELVTSNAVRIYDGSLSMQGRHVDLKIGTFLDVIISNGLQSMNRNDLIVLRYTKDVVSGIESVEFAVIQGTLTEGTAVDPSYTKGDILSGATLHEMPLYRVRMAGLNVASIEPMFKVVAPLSDLKPHKQNLLLNGDFNCDHRESENYTASGGKVKYSRDMWRIHNITLYSEGTGVKITGTDGTATGYLTQFVDVEELADKYTLSALVDGRICTFTTALSSVAAEKVFDKFKFTMLYLSDLKKIKVNICPIGTNSIVIKYVDLFEGTIAYSHIKEDIVTAKARCEQYVQRVCGSYPITYSYPSNTNKSYRFNVPYSGFHSAPIIEQASWEYLDTSGNTKAGNESTLHSISYPTDVNLNDRVITIRTPSTDPKHTDCYAITFGCILTCEHAPTGD